MSPLETIVGYFEAWNRRDPEAVVATMFEMEGFVGVFTAFIGGPGSGRAISLGKPKANQINV